MNDAPEKKSTRLAFAHRMKMGCTQRGAGERRPADEPLEIKL
jgi:hypothetical protein